MTSSADGHDQEGLVTTTSGPYAFTVSQTVRWAPHLRQDWHTGRAAAGARDEVCGVVGSITDRRADDGYCGTCDTGNVLCPGPWYVVDFGDGPSNGLGGMYAEHELEAA